MYICNNCGELFTDFKVHKEKRPYGMGYATEEWAVCPHCGEADFTEPKQCERCGALVAELDEGLCDCCNGDMYGI